MSSLRKILFYTFACVYLIVTPIIIFYALGIIYKPETQKILKTGLIHLSTIPPGAHVYLDGKPFPSPTPVTIGELQPGRYRVTLTLPGYLPWEYTLPVSAEKATVLKHVLLLPRQWTIRNISQAGFDDLLPLKGNPFLLLQRGLLVKDYLLYQWDRSFEQELFREGNLAYNPQESVEPLLPPSSPYGDETVIRIFSEPHSPFLLIHSRSPATKKGPADHFLWLDPRPHPPVMKDISSFFSQAPDEIHWGHGNPARIYALTGSVLDRLDIAAGALYPGVRDDVAAFNVANGSLVLLTKQTALEQTDETGKVRRNLLPVCDLSRRLFSNLDKPRLFIFTRRFLVLLDRNGTLISNKLPHILMQHNVRGIRYAPRKRALLVWTSRKIGILHTDRSDEDSVFERGIQIKWPLTGLHSVKQAFWANNTDYVLFRSGHTVYLWPLIYSPPGGRPYKVVDVKPGSSVFYSDHTGRLYFLNDKSGQLQALRLLPGDRLDTLIPHKNNPDKTP